MKSIYGYWISPKDEIIEVPYEAHAETALREVLKKGPRKFGVYAVMFRLGYVRVVNCEDGDSVEYWSRHRLTKLQKQFTKNAGFIELANNQGSFWTLYEGLIA